MHLCIVIYSAPNLVGSESMILACGERLWVLARRSSEAEEVPDA